MQSNPNPKGRPVQSRQKKEPRATKKRTHRSGPGWREQKKQLKCARRDSNPGRGRSRGRPFFARPKPHHPTMRLGEVEHSKVSYLCQSPGENGILAPLSRVYSDASRWSWQGIGSEPSAGSGYAHVRTIAALRNPKISGRGPPFQMPEKAQKKALQPAQTMLGRIHQSNFASSHCQPTLPDRQSCKRIEFARAASSTLGRMALAMPELEQQLRSARDLRGHGARPQGRRGHEDRATLLHGARPRALAPAF